MSHLRILLSSISGVWLLTCVCAWAWAQTPPASAPATISDPQKLVALLQSNASQQQKLEACQRLALIGTKDCIPVVAALLSDPQLSHAARIALEQIPDPTAAEALRNALPRLKGELLVGVVNSIGVQRDAQALPSLRKLLTDPNSQAACAAATALGRIGTPEAAQALTAALSSTQATVREAVGDGGLRCAESLTVQGHRQASLAVYDALRRAEVSERVRAAATRGAILGRPPVGGGLLLETVKSPSPILFAMALTVGREVHDPAVTQLLLAQLPGLTPERYAAVIRVLGNRADGVARPAALEALKHPSPEVRAAAAEALATIGDASTLDALLGAAVDANAQIARPARESLTAIAGPGMDAALVDRLNKTQAHSRLIVIEAVGRRHLQAAVPELTKLADSPDPGTRRAAIVALGRTIPIEQLSMLIDRFLAPSNPADATAAQDALKEACRRVSDRQRCATLLVERQTKASTAGKCILYELLGTLGGAEGLKAVADGGKDSDEKARDVATRVLGDWPTPDAAAPLLELAKTMTEPRYRIRALRGYLRIARQMDVGDGMRLQMGRLAMAAAERDEERALACEALSRVPSVHALELVLPHLKTASLTTPSAVAAVTIAEKLPPDQLVHAVQPMKQVLQAVTDKNLVRRANEVLQKAAAVRPKP